MNILKPISKIRHRSKITWIQAALALVFLSACEMDDQKAYKMTPQEFALANPLPSPRDYAANNARHKVLMAVIDTGVDYNHAQLINHMHFDLNEAGQPVALGYDFLGLDPIPAPYLARTAWHDSQKDSYSKRDSAKQRRRYRAIVEKDPRLGYWLNPSRASEQEVQSSIEHGTHVAGLMVYDEPELGLIPYRIKLVFSVSSLSDQANMALYLVESFKKAVDHAAAKGVRIVNLSIGHSFNRGVGNFSEDSAFGQAFKKQIEAVELVKSTIASYPQILFVAAAGNENNPTDNEIAYNFPCGIELDNILCVGSLRDDGRRSYFTNIPLNNVKLVFSYGEDVVSTQPTQYCPSLIENASKASSKATLNKLYRICVRQSGIGKMSGTSFASPIVAHLAGQILLQKPEISTGAELANAIVASASPDFIGRLPVSKILLNKPSWAKPVFSNHPDYTNESSKNLLNWNPLANVDKLLNPSLDPAIPEAGSEEAPSDLTEQELQNIERQQQWNVGEQAWQIIIRK